MVNNKLSLKITRRTLAGLLTDHDQVILGRHPILPLEIPVFTVTLLVEILTIISFAVFTVSGSAGLRLGVFIEICLRITFLLAFWTYLNHTLNIVMAKMEDT